MAETTSVRIRRNRKGAFFFIKTTAIKCGTADFRHFRIDRKSMDVFQKTHIVHTEFFCNEIYREK